MDKMRTSVLGPRLFVAAALAVAAWALAFKTGVANTDEAGIVLELPAQVADWTGIGLLFCPNRNCGAQFLEGQLEDPTVCPKCGATLGNMNWAERSLLPADTGLVRKFYQRPGGRDALHATIVLSGDDRSSIHRPQVCMTAAGHEIDRERIIRIPLEGRSEPLDVMVMDMSKTGAGPDGAPSQYLSYYAYWFVGKGRETPSHIQRMVWMATDRIFHNVSHRWAYISVSGGRDPETEEHREQIKAFVRDLYPQMAIDQG